MTQIMPNLCVGCVHYRWPDTGNRHTCAAFPRRIPDAIWAKGTDHRQAYRGDHGIRFEPIAERDFGAKTVARFEASKEYRWPQISPK